jgi:zinc protease
VKWRSGFYDNMVQFSGFGRADLLASFALFDDNPARINSLERELRKVTPELLQKTAQEYLRTGNRTVLDLQVKPKDAPKAGF